MLSCPRTMRLADAEPNHAGLGRPNRLLPPPPPPPEVTAADCFEAEYVPAAEPAFIRIVRKAPGEPATVPLAQVLEAAALIQRRILNASGAEHAAREMEAILRALTNGEAFSPYGVRVPNPMPYGPSHDDDEFSSLKDYTAGHFLVDPAKPGSDKTAIGMMVLMDQARRTTLQAVLSDGCPQATSDDPVAKLKAALQANGVLARSELERAIGGSSGQRAIRNI